MKRGRPNKTNKGEGNYSVKSFYYPLDLDYLEVWTYFEQSYPNRAGIIRKALFKYLYEDIMNKAKATPMNEDDTKIKELIKKIMQMEKQ